MNSYRLMLGSIFLISSVTEAQTTQTPATIQPLTCINSEFSMTGDPYWKSVLLKLTNKCSVAIDFQNAVISFKNSKALNTNFWGNFSPLPYPDNNLNIVSQEQADKSYLATLSLHFPTYQGSSTKLPVGNSIQIQYGTNAATQINGTTNVYVSSSSLGAGTLILKNSSVKPADVSQNYALVHITLNGQKISDVSLPWNGSSTLSNLAAGSYNIAADAITSTQGNTYQGISTPSTVSVVSHQQANTLITYNLVQQEGKIILSAPTLPQQLAGYVKNPSVSITASQIGASLSKEIPWGTATTVTQLKNNSIYSFSTAPINYNGYACTANFNPATLMASVTPQTSKLNYQCIQAAQSNINLNVTGAPTTTLTSIKITFTPNNSATPITKTIALVNGKGTDTVALSEGMIYTLSSDAVNGYLIQFSTQPFVAAANAAVTITLTQQNAGTPIAMNGQLTVCGTKLCNAQGTPIQLKGMSTHGLQWFGKGKCITTASLTTLVNGFKANVIRLALYVQEGGYETNPTGFTQQVNDLINQATSLGMYVIVDWHILSPGDPNYNLERAKKFFTDVATAQKSKSNIIYEIANEPNGVNWATIKSYANQIIPVIRAIDPKAPIIVGTRGWSSLGVSDGSGYEEIVANPITFPNILYAFHFYAASHQDNYLTALDKASNVLPIFVTEFGTQTYSGDGPNDFSMSDRYMQLMANKKIGWTNWNYSDDFRSGAVWNSNTCSQNIWTDDRLKPAGTYIKAKIGQ